MQKAWHNASHGFDSFLAIIMCLVFRLSLLQKHEILNTFDEVIFKKKFSFPAGVYVLSTNLFREYHYVSSPKTWAEAQRYCRETYADLATVDSPEENDRLLLELQGSGQFAWIGLYDNTTDLWANWSDHSLLTFTNWETGQPDNKGSINMTSCAAVDMSTGTWWDVDCSEETQTFKNL
uniref:C-type lectin domain-containing protein n=1 Tax=Poecilia reticulata TaxID=8081 RepID=A0A3P9PU11_POERE